MAAGWKGPSRLVDIFSRKKSASAHLPGDRASASDSHRQQRRRNRAELRYAAPASEEVINAFVSNHIRAGEEERSDRRRSCVQNAHKEQLSAVSTWK